MAAVSPAQPEPRMTVSRISAISLPLSIVDAVARLSGAAGPSWPALDKMMHMANLTLVYRLRLLTEGEVVGKEDATLKLANGHEAHVTMHTIEGSREEIETQL